MQISPLVCCKFHQIEIEMTTVCFEDMMLMFTLCVCLQSVYLGLNGVYSVLLIPSL